MSGAGPDGLEAGLTVEQREGWIKPKPEPLACGWCDAHIPEDMWVRISPTGGIGGVLCITCMARRLVALGINNVPLLIGSGPWDFDTATERIRLEALKQCRARSREAPAAMEAERDEARAQVEALTRTATPEGVEP